MMSACLRLSISHFELLPEFCLAGNSFMQVMGIGVASRELYLGCNFSKSQ